MVRPVVGTGRQYSHGPPAGQIGPKYRERRRSYPVLASLAVGIFRRLEDFLERMVEAPAGRLGAAPQPVTLAKRIARAMDTNKRFGEDGVIVPNRYVLHLSPTDYASFEAYQGSLEEDLAHDVADPRPSRGIPAHGPAAGHPPAGWPRPARRGPRGGGGRRRRRVGRRTGPGAAGRDERPGSGRPCGSRPERRRACLPRGPDRWRPRRPLRPGRRAHRHRARRGQRRDPR